MKGKIYMNGKPSTPVKTRTTVFTGLVLLALVSCTPQDSTAPVEQDPVTRILKEVTVVDPGVTTRFFRFEVEPERPFDPGGLVEAGLDVAGHGVGSLVEATRFRTSTPTCTPSLHVAKRSFVEFSRVRRRCGVFSGSSTPSTVPSRSIRKIWRSP